MYSPCHLAESNKDHYPPSFEALDKLASHISGMEFSSTSFGDVEAVLQEKGQEIIRQLAQGYLSQRSAEEEKKEFVVGEDGIRRSSRRKDCTRKIESRFGEVGLSRIGYYGQFVGSVFPLDAELNLSPDKYSHGLRSEIARLTAVASFEKHWSCRDDREAGYCLNVNFRKYPQLLFVISKNFMSSLLNCRPERMIRIIF